uniref:Uncharacterized protein n=1 Tax=Kalanchoe fedtschenkoi TaxID=63787 RepID=A0A7N0T580_KALFE
MVRGLRYIFEDSAVRRSSSAPKSEPTAGERGLPPQAGFCSHDFSCQASDFWVLSMVRIVLMERRIMLITNYSNRLMVCRFRGKGN